MNRIFWLVGMASAALALGVVVQVTGGETSDTLAAQKAQLGKLQSLVGSWRGVAQPQRGSTKGSWIEASQWAWKFGNDRAELAATIADGEVFSSIRLQVRDKADEFVLIAVPADTSAGEEVRYTGALDEAGKLTLEATKPQTTLPARISIRTVAGGDRLLVLYEKQSALGDKLVRLAEVGYTRKGSGFGKGSTGPECVVTGGYGSMQVSYKGKTYYVCCTGCRDHFNEKPEEVLAEYAARKAEEKSAN